MSPRLRSLLILLFVLLLLGVALRISLKRRPSASADAADPNGLVTQELVDQFMALESRENQLNQTVWAKEILAEQCGQVVESLWDSLNEATNKLEVAASFPAGEWIVGNYGATQSVAHGIVLRESTGAQPAWPASEWRGFVRESQAAGWQVERVEFRHNQFETDDMGQPRQSHFYFSAHLTNPTLAQRAILEGDLVVDWA